MAEKRKDPGKGLFVSFTGVGRVPFTENMGSNFPMWFCGCTSIITLTDYNSLI
jgi:hypothetical protein